MALSSKSKSTPLINNSVENCYSPSLLLASGMLQTKWLNKFVVDLDLEKSAIFRREILSYGKLNSFF